MSVEPRDDGPIQTRRVLSQASKCLRLQRMIRATFRTALASAALLLGYQAVRGTGASAVMWMAAAGITALAGTVAALWRTPPPLRLAGKLDRLTQSRNRLSSALSIGNAPSPYARLAVAECEHWVKAHDFGPVFSLRLPAEAFALLVPLTSILLLQWLPNTAQPGSPSAEALATALELRALAASASRESPETAERLTRSAERLLDPGSVSGRDPEDTARELSLLADDLRMRLEQEQAGSLFSAVAAALEGEPQTAPVAESLREGNGSKAADLLEGLADGPKPDEATLESAREAMRRAADHLSKRSRNRATKVASLEAGREVLRKLAATLREPETAGEGGDESTESLRDLIAAIGAMKNGPDPNRLPSLFDGDSASETPETSDSGSRPTSAGAVPGEENVDADSPELFGAGRKGISVLENATRVQGNINPGESYATGILGRDDSGTANRPLGGEKLPPVPSAAGAGLNERIPLASRSIVLKYFTSIR